MALSPVEARLRGALAGTLTGDRDAPSSSVKPSPAGGRRVLAWVAARGEEVKAAEAAEARVREASTRARAWVRVRGRGRGRGRGRVLGLGF